MDPVPRNVATTGLGIRVTRPARAGQPNRIRVERVVERAAKATFTRTTFAAPGHLGKRLLGKERLLACTRATEAGFPGQTRSMRSGTNQPRRQSDREKRITKSAGSRFELVETAHKSANGKLTISSTPQHGSRPTQGSIPPRSGPARLCPRYRGGGCSPDARTQATTRACSP